jgi:hypothetical protein
MVEFGPWRGCKAIWLGWVANRSATKGLMACKQEWLKDVPTMSSLQMVDYIDATGRDRASAP